MSNKAERTGKGPYDPTEEDLEEMREQARYIMAELKWRPKWRITYESFPYGMIDSSQPFDEDEIIEAIVDSKQTICITIFDNKWIEFMISVSTVRRKVRALTRVARSLISADEHHFRRPNLLTAMRWGCNALWKYKEFNINGEVVDDKQFLSKFHKAETAKITVINRLGGIHEYIMKTDGEPNEDIIDDFAMTAFIEKNRIYRATHRAAPKDDEETDDESVAVNE